MSVIEDLLDFIFPPHCAACNSDEHWWCQSSPPPWPRCLQCDAPSTPGFGPCRHNQPILAVGHYDGQLRAAIHRYKYTGHWAISRDWARIAGPLLSLNAGPDEQLMPIPLHWTRQLRRGYNQVDIFARYLSRYTGLGVTRALKRQRRTQPQIELDTAARAQNIHGAFVIQTKNQPGPIWLVDDISTSGATLKEANRVLRKHGFTVRGAVVIGLAK